MTRGTCSNIGGYYVESIIGGTSTTTAYTYYRPERATTQRRCYYSSDHCPGYSHDGQCYSGRSLEMTCATCANIGGNYFAKLGSCYYYSDKCVYYAVGKQCFTNRLFHHYENRGLKNSVGDRNLALCSSVCPVWTWRPKTGDFRTFKLRGVVSYILCTFTSRRKCCCFIYKTM